MPKSQWFYIKYIYPSHSSPMQVRDWGWGCFLHSIVQRFRLFVLECPPTPTGSASSASSWQIRKRLGGGGTFTRQSLEMTHASSAHLALAGANAHYTIPSIREELGNICLTRQLLPRTVLYEENGSMGFWQTSTSAILIEAERKKH